MISAVSNSYSAHSYQSANRNKQTALSNLSFKESVNALASANDLSPTTSNRTDTNPLFGVLYPPENSFLIYKAENYTAENPTYFIAGKDKGKNFEVTINANDVKSDQASMIEMAALQLYLKEKGVINNIELHPYGIDENNYPTERNLFEKKNVLSAFKEMYTHNLTNPSYEHRINLGKIMSALDSVK